MVKPINKSYRRRNGQQRTLKLILFILVLIVLAVLILELTNTTHFFHKQNPTGTTTQTAPSIKSNNPSTSGGSIQESNITDKQGQGQVTTPSSQWATSSSGLITLKQPTSGSTLKSGDLIAGSAKVTQVWYRLVDNQAGQIGQGPINISGGKFSANISFKASSSTGHLDIFSFQDGKEANEISINLNF